MVYSPSFPKYWAVAACACLCVSACNPITLGVGAGATVGAAATEDRGVGGVYSDTKIRSQINYRWLQGASILMDRVDLSVQDGQVLLTGVVESDELKNKAADLIQDVPGITRIINDIQVGVPQNFADYSRDAWITTKLKTNLLLDKEVLSRNYSVRTVGQVVYLMGTAKDSAELARVIDHASSIAGVKRVVNYTAQKSFEE